MQGISAGWFHDVIRNAEREGVLGWIFNSDDNATALN